MKDALDVTLTTGKLMLVGMSIYAVAMITKPEELELRTSQLKNWWSGMTADRQGQVSNPAPERAPSGDWGF